MVGLVLLLLWEEKGREGIRSINTYTGVLIFNSWDQKIFKAEVS